MGSEGRKKKGDAWMSSPPKDTRILSKFSQQGNQAIFYSSEARFLIDTFQKKSACVCSTNLGFSLEKIVLVLVWGTYYVPHTYVVCTWYQRALRCQLRGRPFHPWAGRLRFYGEAHPGPATLTQSSSFLAGRGSPYTAPSLTGRGMLLVRGLPLRVGGRPMRHGRHTRTATCV